MGICQDKIGFIALAKSNVLVRVQEAQAVEDFHDEMFIQIC